MIKVLKFENTTLGFFAHFKLVISALNDVINNNDKLFVDFTKISSYYDENYKETDNVWEYFFYQPFNLTKNDINENCYYYKYISDFWNLGFRNNTLDYPIDEMNKFRIICKNYIKLRPHIENKINNFYGNNMKNYNILGVQKRGTSHYTWGHGKDQYNLMQSDYFFSKIDPIINNYDKIFLITDELKTLNEFKSKYKDKLIHYDEADLSNNMNEYYSTIGKNKYKTGEDVVIETYLLSKCNYLLAISSNLSTSAIFLNENLKYNFIDKHITYFG
jgi:hypothetical protein